ncbi:MAG TPA: DUF4166 domain-containing protein [Xanthobacteraceae bacterium]|nr:DUF4166 domain-containing protein [Xanthobacteraceae bacterium]
MTSSVRKILILGGYGTFGGRLVLLLADATELTLVVAGRSLANAQAFCAPLKAAATLVPAVFDRAGDVKGQLRDIKPDVVVDSAGPFQLYGSDPYRVVRAAIEQGIHYIDLSDGAAFVDGIVQFDAAARDRGVFILSGASSFPVLTAAVVRRLMAPCGNAGSALVRLDAVAGGIAPSPFAEIGLNVMRAITSYAGKPVEIVRDGRRATAHGIIDTMRFTVAPPGHVPLWRRRFALVDVPEYKLLPQLWPGVRSIWMGAGTVPGIWLRALMLVSFLVRLKILPSLVPFAELIHRTRHALSWGEHRGGMFIVVKGALADGDAVERSWHMIAEGDDGPFIPSMAAAAIIRRSLAGLAPPPGARAATRDLELADYEALFASRKIVTGTRQDFRSGENVPLYRRILGGAYDLLPEQVRVMHDLDRELTVAGVATVDRGAGLLSRLAARIVGFPPAGQDVPVAVTFLARDAGELWRRRFAGLAFESLQEEGRGGNEGLLCERFGPMNFTMALVVDGERLRLLLRRWSILGVPMPLALGPRIDAFEFVDNGRFCFHIEIRHPLAGLIVRYRGWLAPSLAA